MDKPEEWRPVIGFPFYEVSNIGRVRSIDRVVPHSWSGSNYVRSGKLLAQHTDRTGYPSVNLYRNGKMKIGRVHQLVAAAFLPRIDGKNCVNHLDFNRGNNSVENLEWVTQKENMEHATRNGRMAQKLNEAVVRAIRRLRSRGETQAEIARRVGVGQAAVSCVIRGATWGHVK